MEPSAKIYAKNTDNPKRLSFIPTFINLPRNKLNKDKYSGMLRAERTNIPENGREAKKTSNTKRISWSYKEVKGNNQGEFSFKLLAIIN